MQTSNYLVKSTPEAQGISSTAIHDFVKEIEKSGLELHSFMLLRHGQLVSEGWWLPYQKDDPHILFSLSKSFTSTAVGFAVAEGKLAVTDRVVSFFPDQLPAQVSPNLAAMEVRHLLTMTSGHTAENLQSMEVMIENEGVDWVRGFLNSPIEREPGTHFVYNTGATYVLSAIVQQITGQTLMDYLKPRLFEPLGIQNAAWETSPQGINAGGFGLNLTTPEVAAFLQLYLQEGVWQDQPILSESWVREATAPQVSNGSDPESDWAQGYGYQFWRCRHNAYRGDGAFGQFGLVLPDQQAVMVITSGLNDMQAVLNLVWKHLLTAMQPEPLPEDMAAQSALNEKLETLQLSPVPVTTISPVQNQVSGQTYLFEDNSQPLRAIALSFDPQGQGATLSFEDDRGKHQIRCGSGWWQPGTTTFDRLGERQVGASGGWVNQDTYLIKLYYRTSVLPNPPFLSSGTTPFGLTISCRFEDSQVTVEQQPLQTMRDPEKTVLVANRIFNNRQTFKR